jgi:hypothetical protein
MVEEDHFMVELTIWIGCDLVNDTQTSLIAFPSPTIDMPMIYLVEFVPGIQVSFGERCDDLHWLLFRSSGTLSAEN